MPEPKRTSIFASQPGKGIWTTLTILFNAARLPLWLIYFIPRGLRQDPRWTWRQAVRMRIVRAFLGWASAVEVRVPLDLTPNVEKNQWVTLEPREQSYYTGVTLVDPQIKPTKIGGTWYPFPAISQKKGKVVLHFHGGAYVIGDGRKADAGFLAKNLLQHGGVQHVFCCQYRLASNPGGRFPAALQDAITSYVYLVQDRNISPQDIIVSGDSAGANLVLSLLRYLADHGNEVNLANPSCAWLWSPWADPQAAITMKSMFHLNPNGSKDYLNPNFGAWGASCYRPDPSTGLDNNSAYINFVANPFPTETPLWYSAGENEMLMYDIIKSYEGFSKITGNRTELSMEPYAPHDIILVGDKTSFEVEAAEAAKKAGKFLASL